MHIKKIKSSEKILQIEIPEEFINKALDIHVEIADSESNFSKNEILEFFKEGPTISSAENSEINNLNNNLIKWNTVV